MTFAEMDEMWHKIREKHAEEDKGLNREEIIARDNALLREACERLGLKAPVATDS
jgi:hypothetical protein